MKDYLLRQALARGYCTKRNEHKTLDPNLIEDMAVEVEKALTEKPEKRWCADCFEYTYCHLNGHKPKAEKDYPTCVVKHTKEEKAQLKKEMEADELYKPEKYETWNSKKNIYEYGVMVGRGEMKPKPEKGGKEWCERYRSDFCRAIEGDICSICKKPIKPNENCSQARSKSPLKNPPKIEKAIFPKASFWTGIFDYIIPLWNKQNELIDRYNENA